MSTSTSFFHLDTTGMLRAKYNGEKKTGVIILRGLKDKDEGKE